jgi:hypothetical protein
MFTTIRSRFARINQASRLKVNVTFRGHWKTLVRSKTSTCLKQFQYNLAQMFTTVRRSVACKLYVPAAKVKVTHRGQSSDKNITKDDNISRCFTYIDQSISPICISVMPTFLSKASVMGVFSDKVAYWEFITRFDIEYNNQICPYDSP